MKKKRLQNFKKTTVISFGILLVFFLTFTLLELTNRINLFHKHPSNVVPSNNGKSQSSSTTSPTDNLSSTKATGADTPPATNPSQKRGTTAANAQLVEPTGTFVSNHYPGKNNTSLVEASVCNTTPGATCYIQFSKDNVVKTLTTQTADNSGAAYWSWDISTSGLSTGTWKVSAIASLGEQTKTASDAIMLEVQ